jgi:hypothetical protein
MRVLNNEKDESLRLAALCYTLIERHSRMRQIRGVKGEAVVNYCEPLTTKEMAYHWLSLN